MTSLVTCKEEATTRGKGLPGAIVGFLAELITGENIQEISLSYKKYKIYSKTSYH